MGICALCGLKPLFEAEPKPDDAGRLGIPGRSLFSVATKIVLARLKAVVGHSSSAAILPAVVAFVELANKASGSNERHWQGHRNHGRMSAKVVEFVCLTIDPLGDLERPVSIHLRGVFLPKLATR